MASILTQEEKNKLALAADEFGDGIVNLGHGPQFFGLTSMTLGVAFSLNDLKSGHQTLLNNHTNYTIGVNDDSLRVNINTEKGPNLILDFDHVLKEAGWHDINVVVDDNAGTLEVFLDGQTIHSGSSEGLYINHEPHLDVTAGGTHWGRELNGSIANVLVLDGAAEIDPDSSIVERMELVAVPEIDSPETPPTNEGDENETIPDETAPDETSHGEVTDPSDPLAVAASKFGDGITNLGRDSHFFGLTNMTLGVTFSLKDLESGHQTLLNNHTNYTIGVNDDSLRVNINTEEGPNLILDFDHVLKEAGWHDIYVVVDDNAGTLEVFLDGETIHSGSSEGLYISSEPHLDVTAGGTHWGRELNGSIASVIVLDEAVEIDQSATVAERMEFTATPIEDNATPTIPEKPSNENDLPPENEQGNSEASFSGDSVGEILEDRNLTTSGKLTATDSDQGESGFQASSADGTFGAFSIDKNGNWNYQAENSNAFQALNSGDVITENFDVKSIDGTQTTISVKINGVDDEPVDNDNDNSVPGDNEIIVGSTAELKEALSGNVSGYTIKLLPGDYPPFTLSGLNFSKAVTITSADPSNPAHLEMIVVNNSSNMVFDNLAINSEDAPVGSWGEHHFTISGSSNIEVKNSTFGNDIEGALSEGFSAVTIKQSDGVTLTNNTFTNLTNGVGVSYSSNLTLKENDFYNLEADATSFASVQDVLIQDNSFSSFHRIQGVTHSDSIQFWTPSGAEANENITIRNNMIVQGDGGDSAGIFMTASDENPAKNVLIEGNIIYQSSFNGITVSTVNGVEIRDNTVVSPPNSDTGYDVWIRVGNATDYVLEDNVTNSLVINDVKQYHSDSNILTTLDGSTAEYSYSEVFANQLEKYSDNPEDFALQSGYTEGANLSEFANSKFVYTGGSTNNDIFGSNFGDEIFGFEGNDTLFGFGGDDVVFGGAGSDTIDGNTGNDIINGGAGSDVLTGGVGQDIFEYTSTSDSNTGITNRDTITDFDAGSSGDKLSFKGLTSDNFEYLFDDKTKILSVDLNGDAIIDMEIVLIGVSAADLDGSDFLL